MLPSQLATSGTLPELQNPSPHRLVRDIQPTLRKQIFRRRDRSILAFDKKFAVITGASQGIGATSSERSAIAATAAATPKYDGRPSLRWRIVAPPCRCSAKI